MAPKREAVFARLADGDGVIVDTGTVFYFGLNRTATFLWEELSASRGLTADELARKLRERFEVDAAQATRDVVKFLGQVIDYGLAVRQAQPGREAP